MSKKDRITTERTIELEIWLLENCSNDMNNDELLSLLKSNNFSQSEIEYLISAYRIPISDIRKELTIYDSTHPQMDELAFISSLQIKYNCDSNLIIKRIRHTRAINKYLKNHSNITFPDIQVYNKLVRDKIPDIITSNGEKAVYHALNDKEYWEYLLKKDSEELEEIRQAGSKVEIKEELCDKLELIRTMAHYWGFTLEDIIEEANLKMTKKGAFTKKLVLERTYKLPTKKE